MTMTPKALLETVRDLVSSGQMDAVDRLLLETAAEDVPTPLRRAAGILLVQHGHYGEPALSCLAAAAEEMPGDVAVLQALASLQWIRDQSLPESRIALETARRLSALAPTNTKALVLHGLIALSAREFGEAYLTFSRAAVTLPDPEALEPHRIFASNLMGGIDHVRFMLDGEEYVLGLCVHTTQAVESGIAHCSGRLTEIEELRYLKHTLGRAEVIVEVGVLLSNHSVYFLRNLEPKRLYLFEANPNMLPEIRKNTEANNKIGTDIMVRQAFIGDENAAPVAFMGGSLAQRSLSSMVPDKVDLLKIDTDGAELSVLAGAEGLIQESRPFVMLETNLFTDKPARDWFRSHGYVQQNRIECQNRFNTFFRHVEGS